MTDDGIALVSCCHPRALPWRKKLWLMLTLKWWRIDKNSLMILEIEIPETTYQLDPKGIYEVRGNEFVRVGGVFENRYEPPEGIGSLVDGS